MAIIEDHDGTPVFVHHIGPGLAQRVAFCAKGMKDEDRDWLVQAIGRELDSAYALGYRLGGDAVRGDIRSVLGVK